MSDRTAEPSQAAPGARPLEPLPVQTARGLILGGVTIVLIAAVIVAAAFTAVRSRGLELRAELEQSLTLRSQREAEAVAFWLDGLRQVSARIVESEVFRLFAYESELAGGTHDRALAAQLPYMTRLLDDFLAGAGFSHGHLLDRSGGVAVVASSGAPAPTAAQAALARAVTDAAAPRVGPLREADGGLRIDLLIPVYEPGVAAGAPLAVFLFTLPAGEALVGILARDQLDPPGARNTVIQSVDGRVQVIAFAQRPALRDSDLAFDSVAGLAFGERPSQTASGTAYAAAAAVPRTPWWIMSELDTAVAEAELVRFRAIVLAVTALAVGLVVTAFAALRGQVSGGRQRALAEQLSATVAALVHSVESRDPYLAGHSRRVAALAGELAARLGAGRDEIATLRIAANLSQIGKLAVPREILAKPARLAPEEIEVVRRHIDHADDLLAGLDFGLPVRETIAQMHERIDGDGYPKGLAGEAIARGAQILGLCDWFCARVEPRVHRAGITPEAALEILEAWPERYAPDLVAALAQVLRSDAGRRLVADLRPAQSA